MGYAAAKLPFWVLLAVLAAGGTAHAKPITYAAGWMLMQENDSEMRGLHLHYSPSARYAVSFNHDIWRDDEASMDTLNLTYLVQRWNLPEAQGNVFVQMGAGVAENDGDIAPAMRGMLVADYETRRIYTEYTLELTHAGGVERTLTQQARAGFAPYLAETDQLHTWLVLQLDHRPGAGDTLTLTPMVRMFYKEYLWEVGVSDRGDALLNLAIQF